MQLIILTIASFLSWGQIFLENTEPSIDKQVTCKHRIVLTSTKPTHELRMIGKDNTVVLNPVTMNCSKDVKDEVGVIIGQDARDCDSSEVDHIKVVFMKQKVVGNV